MGQLESATGVLLPGLPEDSEGFWKTSEWSSLTMGVVPPGAGGPDEL